MSWWTTVPELTPIAAFDASAVNDTGVLDRVGSNLLLWPNPISSDFMLRSVKGRQNIIPLKTVIALPAQYTLLIFIRPTAQVVMFSRSNTDVSAVWFEKNGVYSTRNSANQFTDVLGGPVVNGAPLCVALVRGASAVSYFANGNVLSTTIPVAHCPDFVGRILGWREENTADYTLRPDADFYAAGIWSGAATQANVQALEAALRVALQGQPLGFRTFPLLLNRRPNPGPADLFPPQTSSRGLSVGRFDVYGGKGKIAGTVAVTPNTPVYRRVRLFDEHTGILVREMWSDPITGAYLFTSLDHTRKYTVVSYDHTLDKRAVIADNLTLENKGVELMP